MLVPRAPRRTSVLAAVLAAGLALTACGDDGVDPSAPEPQRLTVQAAGGEGELKAVQDLLAAFEQANPGVSVDFTGIPSQGDHIAKLATSFAGGQPPDVFLLNYRRLGQFVAKKVVLPPVEPTLEGLFPQPLEAFRYNTTLACLPTNASSTVAYVNPTLFARAGVPLPRATWTWQDLTAASAALHAKGVKAVGFDVSVRNTAPFVWTAGGKVVDVTERPTAITYDTAQAQEALTYLASLQQYGVDATVRAGADPVDLFEQGQLAVYVDSRRVVPAFRKAQGLTFDVLPLPRREAATPSATLLASDAYCVAKASKSPRLAAELARFAALGDGARILAESGRSVPVLSSLAMSPTFLAPGKAPASSQVFLDVLPTARRLPNVAGQDEAEEAADDLLVQFFAGKATLAATVAAIRTASAEAYRNG